MVQPGHAELSAEFRELYKFESLNLQTTPVFHKGQLGNKNQRFATFIARLPL